MPKSVTYCSPNLTQAQSRRLVSLLEANQRKADASLLKKLRASLRHAEDGDRRHALKMEQYLKTGRYEMPEGAT